MRLVFSSEVVGAMRKCRPVVVAGEICSGRRVVGGMALLGLEVGDRV